MATNSLYGNNTFNRTLTPDSVSLPLISQGLDSIRAYQWEIHFELPRRGVSDETKVDKLVLAAKQVTSAGFTTEDITVNRVNDVVYYPGKSSPEEITVTFDNFYAANGKVSKLLWQWYKTTYDPMRGTFGDGNKVRKMSLLHLGPTSVPQYETNLFGVFPISWKSAEFNYSTNEFHTIEVTFRYDFMDHGDA